MLFLSCYFEYDSISNRNSIRYAMLQPEVHAGDHLNSSLEGAANKRKLHLIHDFVYGVMLCLRAVKLCHPHFLFSLYLCPLLRLLSFFHRRLTPFHFFAVFVLPSFLPLHQVISYASSVIVPTQTLFYFLFVFLPFFILLTPLHLFVLGSTYDSHNVLKLTVHKNNL